MDRIKEVKILRVQDNKVEQLTDEVIEEYPLTIAINGSDLLTLQCSPHWLKELAVGYLLSEGLICGKQDILSLKEDFSSNRIFVETVNKELVAARLNRKPTKATGGSSSFSSSKLDDFILESSLQVSAEIIFAFADYLSGRSDLFARTGGVHSSLLCDKDQVLLFADDVGRHNAVDKIIGRAALDGIPLDDKILVCSGRISSEMIFKALKNRIPVVVSRSAPMAPAIETARKHQATLVCFVRGRRMNIYSGEERILLH